MGTLCHTGSCGPPRAGCENIGGSGCWSAGETDRPRGPSWGKPECECLVLFSHRRSSLCETEAESRLGQMTSSGPTDCSKLAGQTPPVITQHCRAKAGVSMSQLLLFPHPLLSPPSCCPHPRCLPWSFSDLYHHPPRVPGRSVEDPEGILTLFWCPVGPWHLEGLGRPEPAALALTKSRCQTENRPPPPHPPSGCSGFSEIAKDGGKQSRGESIRNLETLEAGCGSGQGLRGQGGSGRQWGGQGWPRPLPACSHTWSELTLHPLPPSEGGQSLGCQPSPDLCLGSSGPGFSLGPE